RQLRFQAAVFRWAQAQTSLQAALFDPGDPGPRQRAATWLDDAIERLRAVFDAGDRTVLGDNLRFRLAQALAARAELEPEGSPGRRSREREALDCLQQPATEPGLIGYWHLLKSDLLRRVGEPAAAAKDLDAAIQATPAPPEREILQVRIPLLIGQRHFDQAIKAVEAARLEPPA